MKIATILDHIDSGNIALPEFQRGYVWNRDQVRKLMRSLYLRYPVGGLLVWVTAAQGARTRGPADTGAGVIKMLLDGQQRCTSLYGILRGKPPKFFDGNLQAFTGLHFHVEEEAFEFYAPLKMQADARWMDVTALYREGLGAVLQRVTTHPQLAPNSVKFIQRLNSLLEIANLDLHVDEVTGTDKKLDVVVEIFNEVNSGGTKLSKGDLALAKLGAQWPQVREELKKRIAKYERAGFSFRLEWLLRVVNATITGQALFDFLEDVPTDDVKKGLVTAERRIDTLLNLIAGRLGLDHDRVLGGRYALPLLSRYVESRGGKLTDSREQDKLLYWYIHTFLWGRYSGSTETILAQDLNLISKGEGALDSLIEQLRRDRADLKVAPADFVGANRGARFYPLLYMLTRVWQARDWGTGNPLHGHLLGAMNRLELHHVFPRALLKKKGYPKNDRNALANFTFLTKDTNLAISDRPPADYLPEIMKRQPGALESHWLPTDPALWQVERYHDFLEARRQLLAKAANNFLDELLHGSKAPAAQKGIAVIAPDGSPVPRESAEQEDREIEELRKWLESRGLSKGERVYPLVDPDTGEVAATIDLAWPDGLQEGLSPKIALLLDEPDDAVDTAKEAGFKCFTSTPELKTYVRQTAPSTADEEGGEEEEVGEEDAPATRESWVEWCSDEVIGIADNVLLMVNAEAEKRYATTYALTYRKHYLGLSARGKVKNLVWFRPRKKSVLFGARVGAELKVPMAERLAAAGCKTKTGRRSVYASISPEQVERLRPLLSEVVAAAVHDEHAVK